MYKVMIVGAGKIGSLIACLLTQSGDFEIHLADLDFSQTDVSRLLQRMSSIKTVALDVQDEEATQRYLHDNAIIAVISSLPYFLNTYVAKAAKKAKAHYFDLTEDIAVTNAIQTLAHDANTAFVPQCGLAPGVIGIIANSLMQEFDECHHAKLRVGALPQCSNNALHYALTWSIDGVINEYANPCLSLEDGKCVSVAPLEGLETIQLDGSEYEAFNTSGGLGSLTHFYEGKIKNLDYKTVRYVGHCEKMRFLLHDLKLKDDRETLKAVLNRAIPKTYQDVVLLYVSVEGMKERELIERNYVKKIFPQEINGMLWSAIQISTAAGVCAVVDLVLGQANDYRGLIFQETFSFQAITNNRFGQYYA